MRLAVLIPVMIVLVATSGSSCKSKAPSTGGPATGSIMTAVVAKPSYQRAEPITITITLTNRDGQACRMAGVPDGVVTVASMTRDGTPVAPTLTEGEYINGFSSLIVANTVVVAAGKTTLQELVSSRRGAAASVWAFASPTLADHDLSSISLWPVEQPGKYTITLRYLMPPVQLASPAPCQVAPDPVAINFTVSGG